MGKNLKIIVNISILLIVISFVFYMIRASFQEETTYAERQPEESFVSPYKQTTVYELPGEINRFELYDGRLYLSIGESIYTYDTDGNALSDFSVQPNARDIAVGKEGIYVLYATTIEHYSLSGELIHQWDACSDLSDYCSLALAGDFVFVTDAANKNICKYTKEGNFVRFIESPHGFVIPSYAFDINSLNDTIYCTNSGRHLVETYTIAGDFIAAFGGPGGKGGFFAGCCNPVYISFTPEGELITSEKGNPRICSFEKKGTFKAVWFNSRLLGGGNKAYEVKAKGNQLFVAGKNKLSVYTLG